MSATALIIRKSLSSAFSLVSAIMLGVGLAVMRHTNRMKALTRSLEEAINMDLYETIQNQIIYYFINSQAVILRYFQTKISTFRQILHLGTTPLITSTPGKQVLHRPDLNHNRNLLQPIPFHVSSHNYRWPSRSTSTDQTIPFLVTVTRLPATVLYWAALLPCSWYCEFGDNSRPPHTALGSTLRISSLSTTVRRCWWW